MPFTMTFTADTPAELFAQIAAVAAFGEAPPTKTTASTKPAAKATKTEPTKETKVEAPEEKPDAAEVPSADEVTDAAQAFVKANSREALIELLGSFGSKNISGLPEEHRADFIAKCSG